MGFSKQGYCSGLPFPSPGDASDLGIEPVSTSLAGGFLTTEPPGKPLHISMVEGKLLYTVLYFTFTLTFQFSSVTQPCPTLCNPMNCSTPGLPVHHQLTEFNQTHVHWVGDAIQPSHLLPLLLLPTTFPSIRVSSNESVLHIRWPK